MMLVYLVIIKMHIFWIMLVCLVIITCNNSSEPDCNTTRQYFGSLIWKLGMNLEWGAWFGDWLLGKARYGTPANVQRLILRFKWCIHTSGSSALNQTLSESGATLSCTTTGSDWTRTLRSYSWLASKHPLGQVCCDSEEVLMINMERRVTCRDVV